MNHLKLKVLVQDILTQGNKYYEPRNNNFPNTFSYPFDDGFYINPLFTKDGRDTIDTKNITITFYIFRGLLGHYSGFVFTNSTADMEEFENKVKSEKNDYKIEPNWYMIND